MHNGCEGRRCWRYKGQYGNFYWLRTTLSETQTHCLSAMAFPSFAKLFAKNILGRNNQLLHSLPVWSCFLHLPVWSCFLRVSLAVYTPQLCPCHLPCLHCTAGHTAAPELTGQANECFNQAFSLLPEKWGLPLHCSLGEKTNMFSQNNTWSDRLQSVFLVSNYSVLFV